jgi:ubiquinone biosynthesis protein
LNGSSPGGADSVPAGSAGARRSLFGKAMKRVTRYTEVMGVLLRYGYSDVVRGVDLDVYRRLRGGGRHSRKAKRTWSRAERMRRALEELGPTFVKIGQLMSHRPDLLPADWIAEFEKLRSRVPPADIDDIRKVIREDLGGNPEEIFSRFDEVPIASASIAQVHRAALPDGTEVAVKVQRPGIRRVIESDLAILRDLARIAERRISALAVFHPVDAVRELERALVSELDFRNEADNLDTFRRNFASDPAVCAPEPFRQYSTRRILTMTFVDGIPVGDSEALDARGADRRLIARRGAEAVLKQIFEHRFFHSDPHGDNILIMPDGGIAFLDFGQAGSILPSQRRFLADLLSALIRADAVRAVRAILGWSGYRDPDIVRKLTLDMEHIIERFLSRPFGRIDIGEMVSSLVGMIRRYGIEIPPNFYLLAKAMSTIEDIASSLDPDFDFIRASRPFAGRMIRREMSPERIGKQLSGTSTDILRLLRDLPGEAGDLMSLLKAGRLRMEFELKDLAMVNETIKRVVTRLSAAILLAAMIMGSSILVQSRIPPLFYGIPAIGILGFMISGFIGIYLLFDLWRHR